MEITKDKLIEIVKEAFEVDNVNFNDELDSYDNWDSLSRLSLIALIDEYFDVQISDKEFNEFNTISDLFELLKNKKA